MNDELSQSQKLLHNSQFELYMQGGLELYLAGASSKKRHLIVELEKNVLALEKWDIRGYCTVKRRAICEVFCIF